MYIITSPTGEEHLTEYVTYIRKHPSGAYLITDRNNADGVSYHGLFYLFEDGASVLNVDAGEKIKDIIETQEARMPEGLSEQVKAFIGAIAMPEKPDSPAEPGHKWQLAYTWGDSSFAWVQVEAPGTEDTEQTN